MKGKRTYSFVTALGIFCLLIVMPHNGYGIMVLPGYLAIGPSNTTAQGNWSIAGSMIASSFTGDGAGLTNLNPASLSSGTATISISGNAATASAVTNGVVTTGTYSDPSWITSLAGSKVTGLDCAGGRYEDNGDGTVSDCRTGLIWLKNANCTDTAGGIVKTIGYLSWSDAGTWTANLANGICSLTDGSSAGDWRLPTKTEWMAMVESARKQGFIYPALTNATGTAHWTSGDAFTNILSSFYWSSSTYAPDTAGAWGVGMVDGSVHVGSKTFHNYVWPVRGVQ